MIKHLLLTLGSSLRDLREPFYSNGLVRFLPKMTCEGLEKYYDLSSNKYFVKVRALSLPRLQYETHEN